MAWLIYTALMSVDGFIEDRDGHFDWAFPDPEVHQFANDLAGPVGTELYGRGMYETMAAWQTMGLDGEDPEGRIEAEFAERWRAADKVVYSRTLESVWTPKTRLERTFDPSAVRAMKETSDRDISISGPGLAEHAFGEGLVDEVHLLAFPVVVGAGKAALPAVGRLDLELLDQRRFEHGVVHLHFRTR